MIIRLGANFGCVFCLGEIKTVAQYLIDIAGGGPPKG